MPLYNFECPDCGFGDEFLLPVDSDYPICHGCKVTMEKSISHPAPPIMDSSVRPTGINMDKDNGLGITARIPHYADRNTGKSLGFGDPETKIGC